MDTRHLALTREFRKLFNDKKLLPQGQRYHDFMDEQYNGGVGNKTLTDLKKGATAPERSVCGLIALILSEPTEFDASSYAKPGSRAALIAFIKAKGFNAAKLTPESILPFVCDKPLKNPRGAPGSFDFLKAGIRLVWRLFSTRRMIADRSRLCLPEEVEEAVQWTHVCIAWHFAGKRERKSITLDSAREFAERNMAISGEQYALKLASWRKRLPATVRIAVGRRNGRVGVTVVLPLRAEAYEAVRAGRIESYECTPDDIEFPSLHLLIEVCAERVGPAQADAGNPTLSMLASIMVQLAHLSAIDRQPNDAPIRLLSFAGTPESEERLARQGFKNTGAVMPKSGLAVMERTFKLNSGVGIEAMTAMFLRWVARNVPAE